MMYSGKRSSRQGLQAGEVEKFNGISDEDLVTENRRMLTAMEAIKRIADDMLDQTKRRGPSAKEKAEGQAKLSDPPF